MAYLTVRQELSEQIERLHSEALLAIDDSRLADYRQIASVYEDALLELPRSWKRFGEEFTGDLARGIDFFDPGPLGEISRYLYLELETAFRGTNPEIVALAVELPTRIAGKAISLGADALIEEMLRLASAFYRAARKEGHSMEREAAVAQIVSSMVSFGRYRVQPLRNEKQRSRFWRITVNAQTNLAKSAIDLNDTEVLRQVNQEWDELAGDEPLDGSDLRHGVSGDVWMARYGLAWWALRRLKRAESESSKEAMARAFSEVGSRFNTVSTVAAVASRIYEQGGGRDTHWERWLHDEMPSGVAFSSAIDLEMLDAFVGLSLLRVDEEGPPPELAPAPWLKNYRQQLDATLERVLDEDVWRLVATRGDVQEKALVVQRAIGAAAEAVEEEERDAVRRAEISGTKLRKFSEQVRSGWEEQRLAPGLFKLSGQLVQPGEDALRTPERRFRLAPGWFPKEWFVEASDIEIGPLATDLGRTLARSEVEALIGRFHDPDPESVPLENLRAAAEGLIGTLRGEGSTGLVAFAPSDPRVARALEFFGREMDPTFRVARQSLPESLRRHAVGQLGEVLILRSPSQNDRLWIVDLPRFGRWHQWPMESGETLEVDVEAFNEDQAAALLDSQPDLFREEARNRGEQMRLISERVVVTIQEEFEIEVVDPAAVRGVVVEPA